MTISRDQWVKKAKWLTQALIISCTLNVGLLSTFLYFAIREKEDSVAVGSQEARPIKESQNVQNTLAKYAHLSYQDLLIHLGNKDHVETGCSRRDLALSCLVTFHHFNVEGALGGITLQKRDIAYHAPGGELLHLTLFPGLADYQFQAIAHYARTEKWPFTSEGLFLKLQSSKAPLDPSLIEAFSLTSEFHFIGTLFAKTGIQLKKEYLAVFLSQSSWPILSETAEHLRQSSEFTLQERRHFLLRLLTEDSKIAAKILIETDPEYCLKNFDNEQVLKLCKLLSDKTPPAFLRALLQSPRSDIIWQTAAAILYDQAAEEIPQELNLEETKRRFIELKGAAPRPKRVASNTYQVKPGDSLWKIARDHNTSVKALLEANQLRSDRLNVGQVLRLP